MPLRIAYLDDDPALCEVFKENFESRDVLVNTFIHPTEFLKYLAKETPDLVLIDYRMPMTTGDELAMQIDAKIPKVLLTADLYIRPTAKFDWVMNKPYDFDEMGKFIRGFVRPEHLS